MITITILLQATIITHLDYYKSLLFSLLLLYTPYYSQKIESSFKNINQSIFLPYLEQPHPWPPTITRT